ncbi:MAG TPA: lipopolysaccharide biosynthesis protein [Rhodanobacteraceae bacterium]|nr:lipopolysaccharide biosynthesis protein [Rhodanobacteraceae bacterium]
MSLRNNVLHSLKWLTGVRFVGQFIAWVITLVVIRVLQPSDYGLMAIAGMMVGFAALFREMGLYSAMVQKRDITTRQVEQAFGFLIITNSAIYVVVFFCAPLLSVFFGDPRLTGMIRILGIQFPLASIGVVQDAMLSRRMHFKHKSIVNLVVTMGNGFTTLALALLGAGVWALVYGSLAGAVIRPIGLMVAARYPCRPRLPRAEVADMLRFGGFVTSTRLLWYAYSQADVFIIGKMLGKTSLGFYSIAMELATLPMRKVSELLSEVGLAAYSAVQDDMAVIRSHYRKAIRVISILSFPIFWGISSVSPDLITVVLGQRWDRAIVPLQLLSLIMPVRMVSHGGTGALTAIGKPHIGTINVLVCVIVMLPSFYVGTRYGGLLGASLVWLVAYPIVRFIQLIISLPQLGLRFRDYLQPMLGPALGGAVMYLAVILVREAMTRHLSNGVVTLIVMAGVGALVYSLFMWVAFRKECLEMIHLLRKSE